VKRSERLLDLAISPFDEAYKSIIGLPFGEGDIRSEPKRRTLFLAHEIDEYQALAFDSLMQQLCDASEQPIYIVFNCPGGNTLDGFGMHDTISLAKDAGSPVIGTVRGTAMSMAPVVLQACTQRRMTKNSYLMVHQGWGVTLGSVSEAERDVKWWRAMENRCNAIMANRGNITAKEIAERIKAGNWYLTAKQALEAGFVDEVV
jgi:ATP-dependent protease ClpP protease subunit